MSKLRGTSNLLNIMPKRFGSTATSPKSAADAPRRVLLAREPLRVSRSKNGIQVAALENYSPVTRIAAVINVGARDETHNEQGVTHALRVYSSLATKNYSVFGVSRNLNQIGAELSVSSTREQMTYLLETTRNSVTRGVDILGEILSRPELRHWEIHDAEPRLKFDLDVYDEQADIRLSDLIHRASFKNGLSRSLYAPRFNLHHLCSDTLRNFRNKHFTSNRVTLVGVGINQNELLRIAELFRLPSDASNYTREQSKYYGSEIREDNNDQLVQIALASEGVSASSKEALASAVVSHAFGATGPRIKYSAGASKISKAVLPLATQPALVSSFNVNYTDTGLFGFNLVANKSDVGKLVKGVFKEVAKASKNGLTSQEIATAKNSLKANLSIQLENSLNLIDSIGRNPESTQNIKDLLSNVDNVSDTEINSFVKKIANSKPSLAAIGDLSELPRIDELTSA